MNKMTMTKSYKEKLMNAKYREFVSIFCKCRKQIEDKLRQAYEEDYINDLKDYMATFDLNPSDYLEHMIAQAGRDIERRLDVNQWERSRLPYFETHIIEEDNNATRK